MATGRLNIFSANPTYPELDDLACETWFVGFDRSDNPQPLTPEHAYRFFESRGIIHSRPAGSGCGPSRGQPI